MELCCEVGACHAALKWNLWQSPIVEMRVASGRLCVTYTVPRAAGDVNSIKIGENSNIQDNVVVHVAKHNAQDRALPTIIGNNVTIGVLHASLVITHNTAAANNSNQSQLNIVDSSCTQLLSGGACHSHTMHAWLIIHAYACRAVSACLHASSTSFAHVTQHTPREAAMHPLDSPNDYCPWLYSVAQHGLMIALTVLVRWLL